MTQRLLLLLFCLCCLHPAMAKDKNMAVSPPAERRSLDNEHNEYILPAGTAFQVLTQNPLDTSVNQVGDPFATIMDHNLYFEEDLILGKNTRFNGVITLNEPALQGRDAIMAVEFREIELPRGKKIPIEGHVRTTRPDHQWGGELTAGTKPMLSVQRVWGIGEYNRVVMAGPRAMGKPVHLDAGEHWIIILDKPLTLVVPKPERELDSDNGE